MTSLSLEKELLHRFGFSSFREKQKEIIEKILDSQNVLAIMPTGGGKSLCYQLPACLLENLVLVVSPLISLIQDQILNLQRLGIPAETLHSLQTPEEQEIVRKKCMQKEVALLYVSPEKAVQRPFRHWLRQMGLSLIAIDEAHCVSQWGHDFRPDYQGLSHLILDFPDIPTVALTATADERMQQDIVDGLQLNKPHVFCTGFYRENLCLSVVHAKQAKQVLLQKIQRFYPHQSGIVYCLSRKMVDSLTCWLRSQGLSYVFPYHAGLQDDERKQHSEIFQSQEPVIMVATIAFGMGIDKAHVRFVAHMNLPTSLEAYYQEIGRAGRDQQLASCWMFYGLQDVVHRLQMIEKSSTPLEQKQVEKRKLHQMLEFCETSVCRQHQLLDYFGQDFTSCGKCDNCMHPSEKWEGTLEAQMALSCVYRTNQSFGVDHNTDVLLGKTTQTILQHNHHRLSTFQIGENNSRSMWRSVFRQLLAQGHVELDPMYRSLRLTAKSQSVLTGKEYVFFRKDW